MNYPQNAHLGFKVLAAAWMWMTLAHLGAIRNSQLEVAHELRMLTRKLN